MTRDEFDEHVLRIQLDGYTVLPGLLTSDECEQARKELNSLSEKNMWLSNTIIVGGCPVFFGSGCCPQWRLW